MTEPRPAPYPSDTRAKGWRFELDLERVRQSDTWALAGTEVRPWLFMLWSESWLQTPCGSLPSDDALLCARIGMQAKFMAKHRSALLRGWWLADDGRLYHPTITELVRAMLDKKVAERQRKAEYRERMDAERAMTGGNVPRDINGTVAGLTQAKHGTDDTGTGTSTGTKVIPLSSPSGQKEKPARKRAAAAQLVSVDEMVSEGVNRQNATDWLVNRKEKGLPLTPTAWQQTKDEAAKASLSISDAIKEAAGNGWAGFKATWLVEAQRRSPAPPHRHGSAHAGFETKDYRAGVTADGHLA